MSEVAVGARRVLEAVTTNDDSSRDRKVQNREEGAMCVLELIAELNPVSPPIVNKRVGG
jgi:hypothetical protein